MQSWSYLSEAPDSGQQPVESCLAGLNCQQLLLGYLSTTTAKTSFRMAAGYALGGCRGGGGDLASSQQGGGGMEVGLPVHSMTNGSGKEDVLCSIVIKG